MKKMPERRAGDVGEAEYKRGQKFLQENGFIKADAEGYRRGVEECIAQCFLNDETAMAAELRKYQRGTGGGE